MQEMSLIEKMKALVNIVLPSPFFISLFIISLLTIIVLIINYKVKNKLVKIFIGLSYIFISSYIIIEYGPSVLELSDTLIDKVFNAIYFPSLITYACIILISILLFIRSMIDKTITKLTKYVSISTFCIILFLFILTLDTIISNNIDISLKTEIYTNQSLVVLIQSSTTIFIIWCIIIFIDYIVTIIVNKEIEQDKKEKITKKTKSNKNNITINKTQKKLAYDQQIEKIMKEQEDLAITGEFKILSEEDFKKSFKNYKKKQDYKSYLKIVKDHDIKEKIKNIKKKLS